MSATTDYIEAHKELIKPLPLYLSLEVCKPLSEVLMAANASETEGELGIVADILMKIVKIVYHEGRDSLMDVCEELLIHLGDAPYDIDTEKLYDKLEKAIAPARESSIDITVFR